MPWGMPYSQLHFMVCIVHRRVENTRVAGLLVDSYVSVPHVPVNKDGSDGSAIGLQCTDEARDKMRQGPLEQAIQFQPDSVRSNIVPVRLGEKFREKGRPAGVPVDNLSLRTVVRGQVISKLTRWRLGFAVQLGNALDKCRFVRKTVHTVDKIEKDEINRYLRDLLLSIDFRPLLLRRVVEHAPGVRFRRKVRHQPVQVRHAHKLPFELGSTIVAGNLLPQPSMLVSIAMQVYGLVMY